MYRHAHDDPPYTHVCAKRAKRTTTRPTRVRNALNLHERVLVPRA